MSVFLVISLPIIPYTSCICIWLWPTILTNIKVTIIILQWGVTFSQIIWLIGC